VCARVAIGAARAFTMMSSRPRNAPFLIRGEALPGPRPHAPSAAVTSNRLRLPTLARWCALALAAVLPACNGGDGPVITPPGLSITASGRLERGSTITFSVTRSGSAVTPTLTFVPADGAQLLADGSVRLLRAGTLTVNASLEGSTGSKTLEVAAPPVVVFDRLTGGNRDIWRVDLDGQNLVQLTTDPGDDQDPTAVKGSVVFVSYRAGNAELFTIPLAGGATTRLTTTSRDETTPALSGDGTKLAFSAVSGGVTKVFTAAANATSPVQVVPGTGAEVIETAPSWSLSASVAFVSTAAGSADIVQVVGGGGPTPLAASSAADVEPAWSADGNALAFISNRGGPVEIYLRSAAGAVTQLTAGTGSRSNPAWTPDGRLVYVESVGGVSRLRWIDPAAPTVSTLIDTGAGAVSNPSVHLP
jgi:Tol biopolymer transport system component